jgi:wyosine [tRNA(Phe)-imidazoG37] synthetase (radical SAM superfamily)
MRWSKEDRMLLSPKKTITYGPVNSRRLGRSLGINILPPGQKTCTFNCVYCQYGWTDFQKMTDKNELSWPSAEEVCDALEKELLQLPVPPAYFTFSGNGEPTLHPAFPDIVAEVNAIRDRIVPDAQTAVLSNSTLVANPDIRKALSYLDRRIMKLDCGDDKTYSEYNKPYPGFELEEIVDGLKHMKDVTIQALFSAGEAGNLTGAHLEAWLEKIKDIGPIHVQVYSLDRDAPAKKLIPASQSELRKVKRLVNRAGFQADIYSRSA